MKKNKLRPAEFSQLMWKSVASREVIIPLCSCEAPSGALCLGPPIQERQGAVGEGLEEGHKDDQWAEAPPLQRQAEGAGLVQLGEKKAVG